MHDGKIVQVGVMAEPEMLRRHRNCNDRFIIIASDGVWEFLSNQVLSRQPTIMPDGSC